MKKILVLISLVIVGLGYSKAQTTTRLQVNENTISLFGRKVELDKNGFPKQIQTFYNQDASRYLDTANNLLFENIHFHFVRKGDGKNIKFIDQGNVFIEKSASAVRWKAKSVSDSLQVDVDGLINVNGQMVYAVKVTVLQDVELKDVTMHIPFQKTAANYVDGLIQKYGSRPEKNRMEMGWRTSKRRNMDWQSKWWIKIQIG
jgi:hypothetical protein